MLLLKISNNWKPTFEGEVKDILSTDNRKLLIKESMMNKANLSNYIKSLHEKKALIKNAEGISKINPILEPNLTGGIVEYTFTLDTEEK